MWGRTVAVDGGFNFLRLARIEETWHPATGRMTEALQRRSAVQCSRAGVPRATDLSHSALAQVA